MRAIIIGILGAALFANGAFAQNASPKTLIYAGNLIAKPGSASQSEMTIVIEGKNIANVLKGFVPASPGDKIVDLKNKTVLPGLIDSHVHLMGELGPMSKINAVTKEESDYAFIGMINAQKTLKAGFTTVVDLGADGSHAIFALRDMIEEGKIIGPRIIASGTAISATGGHGDVHGYREDILHILSPETICDGADDCRRAVRYQVKLGADIIKVTATGGVLSDTAAGVGQQLFDDELKAVADTAHSMGRKITAHAHGKGGIDAALKAGFDSIEHGTMMDKDTVELFKKSGAYLVPTALAGFTVAEMAKMPNAPLSPAQKEKAAKVGPMMKNMLKLAHDNGVKVAFGTDSGVSKHGDNAMEFVLMVEAGFTPQEALKSATIDGADHLGLSNLIGTIETGKAADIIAVANDPYKDIKTLLDVKFVMKAGIVAKE